MPDDQPQATDEPNEPNEPEQPDEPDEATLLRIATPGTARRAPRFGAFIVAGILAGAVLGVILASVVDTGALAGSGGGVLPFLDGANSALAMTAFALAGVGALVGALLALLADRRSLRRGRMRP